LRGAPDVVGDGNSEEDRLLRHGRDDTPDPPEMMVEGLGLMDEGCGLRWRV